ncbi:MAG: ATP-binding protein [Alphaproteobacteria bacterium]|nr:ATP-binding protein [Alphaproteobacteria bacterium]
MTDSDLNLNSDTPLAESLNRIADALEILTGGLPSLTTEKFDRGTGYVWDHEGKQFRLVEKISAVKLDLLVGIADQRDQLLQNSLRFYQGKPSNNALLWGARGMGKSSLVKAIHAHINETRAAHQPQLILIEIHREDLSALPLIQNAMRQAASRRFIIFCDDLSFDRNDTSYKSLKTMLEGGIEGRPENVIFYATSNRRHILARDMIDNEQTTGLIPGEGIEEKVSLSDRFGLWLGFHACSQDEYLTMVHNYAKALGIRQSADKITAAAIEWSVTRGSRSGRVAWQFVQQIEN